MNIWYLFASIVGVLAWAAIIITWTITRNRRRPTDEQSAGIDKVLTRLDSLDARLAKVEKTLNDIP